MSCSPASDTLAVSVVVPVRNAEGYIGGCLESVLKSKPYEVIVVDGCSSDGTLEIVERYPVRILSDHGRGVAAARTIGVEAATCPWIAFIDTDVVLPDGALARLLQEAEVKGYVGLQSGLISVSGPGYWGRALVYHHTHSRVRNWFGVGATIFKAETITRYNFDQSFRSGEDIELRWRLHRGGEKLGVSTATVATHRFSDTFAFAREQWIADGRGLARMVLKFGLPAIGLLAMPLAGGVRGIVKSCLTRQFHWIPYFFCYVVFNYLGIAIQLSSFRRVANVLPVGDGSSG